MLGKAAAHAGDTALAQERALSPARQAKLQQDQLTLVLRNLGPTAFAMPVFGAIMSLMLSAWVPGWQLAVWVVTLAATSSIQFGLYAVFSRAEPRLADLPRWTVTASVVGALSAISWTAPALLFWGYCPMTGHLLIALVYACSVAACAALQSSSPPMLVSTLVPYSMALVLPSLFEGTSFYIGLAALGVGLCLFMCYLARQVYLTSCDMFSLREDKNELIEQLTAAKIESDKARQRAEAASQAKSEFLANMSHELRTPLNAILGFSEVMKDEAFGHLGSRQYVDYAGHIHNSGQHLLGLINDVLDLSRIEAGRFAIRSEEIDLRAAIANALAMFELPARQAGVNIKADLDSNLPLLLADDRGLRQVLLNLISNAVKFTPAGGTVTAFARRSAGGGMELGVTDTGAGIDPVDIATVFEAFGQGRHDVSAREKGTGLGLPIVRGLVEAHGGKVRLESVLGQGTTVVCTFPRERLSAPQPVPIRLATVL